MLAGRMPYRLLDLDDRNAGFTVGPTSNEAVEESFALFSRDLDANRCQRIEDIAYDDFARDLGETRRLEPAQGTQVRELVRKYTPRSQISSEISASARKPATRSVDALPLACEGQGRARGRGQTGRRCDGRFCVAPPTGGDLCSVGAHACSSDPVQLIMSFVGRALA